MQESETLSKKPSRAERVAAVVEKAIADASGISVARASMKMANEVMTHYQQKEQSQTPAAKPEPGPMTPKDLEKAAARDKSKEEANSVEFHHEWWQSVIPNHKLEQSPADKSETKSGEKQPSSTGAIKPGDTAAPHDKSAFESNQKLVAPLYQFK